MSDGENDGAMNFEAKNRNKSNKLAGIVRDKNDKDKSKIKKIL